jgi:hypothetical protein
MNRQIANSIRGKHVIPQGLLTIVGMMFRIFLRQISGSLTIFPRRFIVEAESFSGSDESDLTNEQGTHNRNRTSSHLSLYPFIVLAGKQKRLIMFRKMEKFLVGLAFVWALVCGSGCGAVFTVAKSATLPDTADLPILGQPDHKLVDSHEGSERRAEGLQSVCIIRDVRELLYAETDLLDETETKTNACISNGAKSCRLDIPTYKSYNRYNSACSAANGVLATYDVTISCTWLLSEVYTGAPFCLISKQVDANCDPATFADELDYLLENGRSSDCTVTAVSTEYTDYSTGKNAASDSTGQNAASDTSSSILPDSIVGIVLFSGVANVLFL